MTAIINDILSITRTAAMIYAEENLGNRKTDTIKRKFIESIFVIHENKCMTILTIVDALEEDLSITYSEHEVLSLIKEHESFEYIAGVTSNDDMYRLSGKRYMLLQERGTDVIQNTMRSFLLVKTFLTKSLHIITMETIMMLTFYQMAKLVVSINALTNKT